MSVIYFIAPGQALRRNGRRYPAGAQAPADLPSADLARYLESGLLERRETSPTPTSVVESVLVKSTFVHPDWTPSDPATIANVPTRTIPRLLGSLASVEDVELVALAEQEGKNRSTVLARCAERIKQIKGG